jgi:hypothetical protein
MPTCFLARIVLERYTDHHDCIGSKLWQVSDACKTHIMLPFSNVAAIMLRAGPCLCKELPGDHQAAVRFVPLWWSPERERPDARVHVMGDETLREEKAPREKCMFI